MRATRFLFLVALLAVFGTITAFGQSYTPVLNPSSLTIAAGGAPASFQASLTPSGGFNSGAQISFANVPAGVTITPTSQFIDPPYNPVTFTVQASSTATPGNYLVSVNYSSSVEKSTSLGLTITGGATPDYRLNTDIPAVTIAQGATSQVVTISGTSINAFSGIVNVTASSVAGLTVTPSSFTVTLPGPDSFQHVTFTAAPNAAPGTYPVTFTGESGGIVRSVTVNVTITAAGDFSIGVTPPAITVQAGQSGTATVTATGTITGSIVVMSAPPAGITVAPTSFLINAGGSQPVTITVAPGTAAGTYTVRFTGSAGALQRTADLTVNVTTPAQPDFTIEATPNPLIITAGQSAQMTFTVRPVNGFNGTVTLTPQASPGLSFSTLSLQLTPNVPQQLTIIASPDATPGPRTVTFTGVSGTIQRTVQTTINIQPAPVAGAIAITAIAPNSVVQGTRSQTIRVAGTGFQTGATALFAAPGILVERVVVYSATLADVTITVSPSVAPGAYRLDLRNPDGAVSQPGGTLLVYPPNAIGAPLSVTTAAIVYPVEGTIVASHENIYPRALLATTGTGTIVGYWALNGVAFDRFTATVAGGFPVEVRTNVPIPPSPWGAHRLEVIIETPKKLASPDVNVVFASDSATRLVIYAPRDRSVIDDDVPIFRWTLLPGVSGYEVEIDPEESGRTGRRIRTSQSQWRPTREEMLEIAGGSFRWRVRGIYPGEVRGEPSEWASVIITPSSVSLRATPAADGKLAWSGGAAGLLYRVEFLDSRGRLVADALTWKSEYVIPYGAHRDDASSVRITAVTPRGRVAGRSAAVSVPDAYRASSRQSGGSRLAEVTSVSFSGMKTHQLLEVRYKGKLDRDAVAVFVNGTDVTAMSSISDGVIQYAALNDFRAGNHNVRVLLAGASYENDFTVRQEETAAETSAEPPRRDYVVTPMGTITAPKDEDPSARLQLSTQGDLTQGAAASKFTGDVSYAAEIDPSSARQESRNWVADFASTGETFGGEAKLGYTTPDFTDGAEFLTSGLARTGVTGKVRVKGATLSYYQPIDTAIHGVLSNVNENLEIRSAAISTPEGKRYSLRLIGLQVEDPGSFTFGTPRSELETFGVFGRFEISPRLSIAVEAAQGKIAGTGESRDGNAFRVELNGAIGTFTYGLNVRDTGANFVNPANRALTAGGVADRFSTDVSLGKIFGATSVNLTLRRQQAGRSEASTLPDATQTGANLSLSRQFGRVLVSLAANTTADEGEANDLFFMPATDRTQSGVTATFSETFGRFNTSQTLSWQNLDDDANATASNDVGTITLSFGGSPLQSLNFSSNVGFTRTEAHPILGTTENITASIQPSIAIPGTELSLQPSISWSRNQNDVTTLETDNALVQASLQWSPTMLGNLLAAQISTSINRTENSGAFESTQTDRSYEASLTMKLNKARGVALFPSATVIPGTVPMTPPESVGTDSVQASSSQPATPPAAATNEPTTNP